MSDTFLKVVYDNTLPVKISLMLNVLTSGVSYTDSVLSALKATSETIDEFIEKYEKGGQKLTEDDAVTFIFHLIEVGFITLSIAAPSMSDTAEQIIKKYEDILNAGR